MRKMELMPRVNKTLLLLLFSCLSCVWLFAAPGTVVRQAPLSMGFPRQKYWSGLPVPSLGDILDSGIEPLSAALRGFLTTKPLEAPNKITY